MRCVPIGPGISATCLGFGTATLARLDSRAQILARMEEAFDSGITYFDTARVYGHGTMEGLLGTFLSGKRDRVTVATKFGLEPPASGSLLSPLLYRAKGFVKKIGFIRNRVRRMATASATGRYDANSARLSLERSLRELRTDFIDIFLIHEGTAEDASNEQLIEFLEAEKRAGRIRAFGLAANYSIVSSASTSVLARCDVIQIPNDILSGNKTELSGRIERPIITHSIFAPLPALQERLKNEPHFRSSVEAALGISFQDPAVLPRLLVQCALADNPSGVTLFSATRSENIRATISASDAVNFDRAQKFRQLLAQPPI